MEAIEIPKFVLEDSGLNNSQKESESKSDDNGKAQELVSCGVRTLDKIIKHFDSDLGIDPAIQESYSELISLVAERNLGSDILKWSPEIAAGIASVGIAAENLMVYSAKQKRLNKKGESKENKHAEDKE